MLDHRAFLSNPDSMLPGLRSRGVDERVLADLTRIAQERRQAIVKVEALRHEQNQASQALHKLREQDPKAFEAGRERLRVLKDEVKAGEDAQAASETALAELMLGVPNLPHPTVPVAPDASGNRVERVVGTPTRLPFPAKNHWELGEQLGILDFERAAKVSGARFVVYRGEGARLERALIAFMLDLAREHGYVEIIPPLLVRPESMMGAGQYPKFIGESFETEGREYVLIPTSEVPLVNLHQDEILEEDALPVRYAAYTPCFRREAGAAGRDTRGLIRQHQFNKVELVAYATPDKSMAELERLTGNAEEVLKRLELPYRVVTLCTGDLGFASTKTYDLEVWLPGQDTYREISSCSNCSDFQARRARIRYRPKEGGAKAKPQLVHTLNGSGIAVGRTFVAVLENYQRADGSIAIPKALVPYFGATEIKAR